MANYYVTSGTNPVPAQYSGYTIIKSTSYDASSATNGYVVSVSSDSNVVVAGDVNDDVIVRTTGLNLTDYKVTTTVLDDTTGAAPGSYDILIDKGVEGDVIPTLIIEGDATKFDAFIGTSPSGANVTITSTGSLNSYTGSDSVDTITVEGTVGTITTSGGADNITVNGGTVGNIYSGLGADTISINDGTVTGVVDGGGFFDISNDSISVTNGSSVAGGITSGGGADSITVSGSSVGGNIVSGIGADSVTISDSTVTGTVSTTTDAAGTQDAEGDSASITSSSIGGNVLTGGGNDSVTLHDVNVGGFIDTAFGNDFMSLSGNVTVSGSHNSDAGINSSILLGMGADTLHVDESTNFSVTKPINLGADGTAGVYEDELKFLNVTDKATLDKLLGKAGFSDTNGDGSYDTDYAPGVPTYQPLGSTFGTEGEFTYNGADFINVDYTNYGWPCFASGTLIETDRGAVAIEKLEVGDLVMTRDNGLQPIRWIGCSKADIAMLATAPNLRPIRIRRHALGANVPSRDLLISPQHRVLVRSKIAQKMFGTDEILVAAKQLCQIDGIDIADDVTEVDYYHMLFERHEVVFSNGAETESLYTGPEALKSIGAKALEEIFTLFPQLKDHDYTPSAARPLATGRMGRKLAIRHIQNRKALVQ